MIPRALHSAAPPRLATGLALGLATLTPAYAQHATAPAPVPSIPEPMVFDMIRPLGARRGELEANTLAQVNLSGASRDVEWAPEV